MRLVDRFLIIISGLVLIGVVTVLLLVPESLVAMLETIQTLGLIVRLVIVIVVNIVILIILYLLTRSRRQPSKGLAVNASGAFADVSVESARTNNPERRQCGADVTAAGATVKAVEGRADVDLNVQVSGKGVAIPQKQREINRALSQVINKQLGLRMRGKPRVHITLEGEQATAVDKDSSLLQPDSAIDEPMSDAKAPSVETRVVDAEDTETPDRDMHHSDTVTDLPDNDNWLNKQISKLPVNDSVDESAQKPD